MICASSGLAERPDVDGGPAGRAVPGGGVSGPDVGLCGPVVLARSPVSVDSSPASPGGHGGVSTQKRGKRHGNTHSQRGCVQ